MLNSMIWSQCVLEFAATDDGKEHNDMVRALLYVPSLTSKNPPINKDFSIKANKKAGAIKALKWSLERFDGALIEAQKKAWLGTLVFEEFETTLSLTIPEGMSTNLHSQD